MLSCPRALSFLRLSASLSLSSCLLATLAGCGIGTLDTGSGGTMTLNGKVFGGQQPVGGSVVRLYAAGTGGNASAATNKLTLNGTPGYVITSGDGGFNITGDYACTNGTDQMYIVATGGNPGLAPNTNNPALVEMAALGSCANLSSSTNIFISEVTTVAAAWALAPFMTSAANLGSSSSNQAVGLTNAFLNAQLLADTTKGQTATLPANLTVETGKINALASALGGCVNSDGTTGCAALFAAATVNGVAPTDTLGAALNIVKNPGSNVTAVWNSIPSQAVFPTTLTKAPNDWTMSLTVANGVINPTQLGVDTQGNVWVADYYGGVSAFSPQGKQLSPSLNATSGQGGFGGGVLLDNYGLTVGTDNNVWVTNTTSPSGKNNGSLYYGSVVGISGVSSGNTLGTLLPCAGTTGNLCASSFYFYDYSMEYPESLATQVSGNIVIGQTGNVGSATMYDKKGNFVLSGAGQNYASYPSAVSGDPTGGIWLANQGYTTVTHTDSAGRMLSNTTCCNRANGIATDVYGNAWVANYGNASVSEVGPGCDSYGAGLNPSNCPATTNPVVLSSVTGGGVNYPATLAVDAAQNVWVANFRGNSFSELVGNVGGNGTGYSGTLTPGTGISPSYGYGLDANMATPYGLAPDASGNIWISDYGTSTVLMFFGLATPTATPALPVPKAP